MTSNLKTHWLRDAVHLGMRRTALRARHKSRIAKLYDQGVNAYFAGGSCQADALLSEALTFNSQDPRAYYFRALSLLRRAASIRPAAICSSARCSKPSSRSDMPSAPPSNACKVQIDCCWKNFAAKREPTPPSSNCLATAPRSTPPNRPSSLRGAGCRRAPRESASFRWKSCCARRSADRFRMSPAATAADAVPPKGNQPATKPDEQPAAQPAHPRRPKQSICDDSEPNRPQSP